MTVKGSSYLEFSETLEICRLMSFIQLTSCNMAILNSDISVTKSYAESVVPDHLKYPTLGLGSSFAFKVEDSKGSVHRFNCGMPTLKY